MPRLIYGSTSDDGLLKTLGPHKINSTGNLLQYNETAKIKTVVKTNKKGNILIVNQIEDKQTRGKEIHK